MSLRFSAIRDINKSNESDFATKPSTKVSEIFGENVFTLRTAREFLSDEAYKSLNAVSEVEKELTARLQARLQMASARGQRVKALRISRTGFNR